MNYFYAPGVPDGQLELDEEESAHCIKVLRLRESDQIGLLDGNGGMYTATIEEAHPKHVRFSILSKKLTSPPPYHISLAIAPTKSTDRMEWLVEKLTEIGVNDIYLFFSQNSERRKYRIDRLQKKIIGALKQSKNPFMPRLHEPSSLKEIVALTHVQKKFIAHVDMENTSLLQHKAEKHMTSLLLIGPEGDFSQDEVSMAVEKGFDRVSLGSNVLRTETAALVGCNILHLINNI